MEYKHNAATVGEKRISSAAIRRTAHTSGGIRSEQSVTVRILHENHRYNLQEAVVQLHDFSVELHVFIKSCKMKLLETQ